MCGWEWRDTIQWWFQELSKPNIVSEAFLSIAGDESKSIALILENVFFSKENSHRYTELKLRSRSAMNIKVICYKCGCKVILILSFLCRLCTFLQSSFTRPISLNCKWFKWSDTKQSTKLTIVEFENVSSPRPRSRVQSSKSHLKYLVAMSKHPMNQRTISQQYKHFTNTLFKKRNAKIIFLGMFCLT